MDDSDRTGNLSPRQEYYLGQQNIETNEKDLSPTASQGMSQRESIVTPLQPAATMPIILNSQNGNSQFDNVNEHNEDLATVADNKSLQQHLPMRVFATQDIPTVPTEKTGYRHHLPRQGQPGNRLITAGILSSKQRAVSMQPAPFILHPIISTKNSITGSENNEQISTLVQKHVSISKESGNPMFKTSIATKERLATQGGFNVHIKNKMLTSDKNKQEQNKRMSIAASSVASSSFYQGPALNGMILGSRMQQQQQQPKDTRDSFFSKEISVPQTSQFSRDKPTTALVSTSFAINEMAQTDQQFSINPNKKPETRNINMDINQVFNLPKIEPSSPQLLVIGIQQNSSRDEIVHAEAIPSITQVPLLRSPKNTNHKVSSNVSICDQFASEQEHENPTSYIGETRLGQHLEFSPREFKISSPSVTDLISPNSHKPKKRLSTYMAIDPTKNFRFNEREIQLFNQAVTTIEDSTQGANSLRKTESGEQTLQATNRQQYQQVKRTMLRYGKQDVSIRVRREQETTAAAKVINEQLESSIFKEDESNPMRVSAYRQVDDLSQVASSLRFGIPDGINGMPTTGTLNQSCEVNTHQVGVIISNNSVSLQGSPKRIMNKKQKGQLQIEHIMTQPRMAIYERLKRNLKSKTSPVPTEQDPSQMKNVLREGESPDYYERKGNSTQARDNKSINTTQNRTSHNVSQFKKDQISNEYTLLRPNEDHFPTPPKTYEADKLQIYTSISGNRQQLRGSKKRPNFINRNICFDSHDETQHAKRLDQSISPDLNSHSLGFRASQTVTNKSSQMRDKKNASPKPLPQTSYIEQQRPSLQAQMTSTLNKMGIQRHMTSHIGQSSVVLNSNTIDSQDLHISGNRPTRNSPFSNIKQNGGTQRTTPTKLQSLELGILQAQKMVGVPFKSYDTTVTAAAAANIVMKGAHNVNDSGALDKNPIVGVSLSKDTSRSPIPIDYETSKRMKMQLPPGFDDSNHDLSQLHQSASQIKSSNIQSAQSSVNNLNADLKGVKNVKGFIMSPRQNKITSDQKDHGKKQINSKEQEVKQNLRNVATQYSDLKIQSQLSQVRETETQSSINSKKQIAAANKAHRDREDLKQQALKQQNSSLATVQLYQSQEFHQGKSFDTHLANHKSPIDSMPDVVGKNTVVRCSIQTQNTIESLLVDENMRESQTASSGVYNNNNTTTNNELSNKGQSSLLKNVQNNSQKRRKKQSRSPQLLQAPLNNPNTGDVAIRINKINIQINPETAEKQGGGDEQVQTYGSMMSNYKMNTAVTDYSHQVMRLSQQNATEGLVIQGTSAERINEQNFVKGQKHKNFAPVLKTRSYRVKEGNLDQMRNSIVRQGQMERHETECDEITKQVADVSMIESYQEKIGADQMLVNEYELNSSRELEVVADLIQIGESQSKDVMQLAERQAGSDYDIKSRSQLKGHSLTNVVLGPLRNYSGSNPFDNLSKIDLGQSTDEEKDSEDASDSVNTEMALSKLKLDVKGRALHQKTYGNHLDWISKKAKEFMNIQDQLPQLDYNTGNSEAKNFLDNKVDFLLKNIALSQQNQGSNLSLHGWQGTTKHSMNKTGGICEQGLYDVNQKRNLHIKNELPTHMIKFKSKSEQQCYLRVAKCILSLHSLELKSQHTIKMKKADVEFTYMKIFRFLADTLSNHEFDNLSYYHVKSFIQAVIKISLEHQDTSNTNERPPMSLKQFVCKSLDLKYDQSKVSHVLINQDKNMIKPVKNKLSKSLKNENKQIDLYLVYEDKKLRTQVLQKQLQSTASKRHNLMFDKIQKEAKTVAAETALPTVMRSQDAAKGRETLQSRGNVARLLAVNKRHMHNDVCSDSNLWHESTIARNKVVLEHVMAERNLRDWRNKVLSELHEESRQSRTVATSQTRQDWRNAQYQDLSGNGRL